MGKKEPAAWPMASPCSPGQGGRSRGAAIVWLFLLAWSHGGCFFDYAGLRPPDQNNNNGSPPGCGNGALGVGEGCDDGNQAAGDGCDAQCQVEPGWDCAGEPSVCVQTCGNGVVDGNETCDDANLIPEDGCDAGCQVEPGWVCAGEPSVCVQSCGNGVLDQNESCDDANLDTGDGCNANCQVEPGWDCTSNAPACEPICGDGLVVGSETCDDANLDTDDGCNATCQVEDFYACSGQPSACQCVIYVDIDAVPNPRTGARWNEALDSVNAAISAASAGCEVWVAEGTYFTHAGSRDDTIWLKTDVGVYGGFAAGENDRSQRDWRQHVTILSGWNTAQSERVYHVVRADGATGAIVDGFTVTAGEASSDRDGGGFRIQNASIITLANMRVESNWADNSGGGIFVTGSQLTVGDSIIIGNQANDGAGVGAHDSVQLTVERCAFVDNFADNVGGGLRVYQNSTAYVEASVFFNNRALDRYGGGVHNWDASLLTLVNCTFRGNRANQGAGAVRNYDADGCEIRNSILWDNAPNALEAHNTTVTITYTDIQDSGYAGSDGNISEDPLFAGPVNHRLLASSPCIDTADDAVAPATDLEGFPRVDISGVGILGTLADMGALEYQP